MSGALSGEVLRGPRVWVAVFLLGSCSLLNLYSTQPILTEVALWGDTTLSAAAWTISAATFGIVLMAPIAGSVSDRLGRKRVMCVAIAVMIAVTLLCSLSPLFPWLLGLRLIQGLVTPFVFTVAVAYIAEESAGAHTTALNSVYIAGTAFGGFAGRFFAGLTLDVSGSWRAAFLTPAILLAFALLTTFTWLPRESRFSPARSFFGGLRGVMVHVRDWRVIATCLVGACLLFQQVVSFTFGSLHLLDAPFHLTAAQVGLVFVVFLAPTVVTPFVGPLITRVGLTVTFWSATLLGAGGLALALHPFLWANVLGLLLSCIAVFAGQACATAFTGRHCRRFKSAAVGLYLTAYYLGGTIGGFAPAALYVESGWNAVVLLLIGATVLSAIIATSAWRTRAKS